MRIYDFRSFVTTVANEIEWVTEIKELLAREARIDSDIR